MAIAIIVKFFVKVLLSFFSSMAAVLLCNWMIEYVYVKYYEIPSSEDLSNDYGLGMILFFSDIPIFIISLCFSLIFFFKGAKK